MHADTDLAGADHAQRAGVQAATPGEQAPPRGNPASSTKRRAALPPVADRGLLRPTPPSGADGRWRRCFGRVGAEDLIARVVPPGVCVQAGSVLGGVRPQ
jgi:hypothetical protein